MVCPFAKSTAEVKAGPFQRVVVIVTVPPEGPHQDAVTPGSPESLGTISVSSSHCWLPMYIGFNRRVNGQVVVSCLSILTIPDTSNPCYQCESGRVSSSGSKVTAHVGRHRISVSHRT
jgi:hypothetical protein